MMAELGGPLPREGIEAKVRADVDDCLAGRAWVQMIVPDESVPQNVAGSVVVWSPLPTGRTSAGEVRSKHERQFRQEIQT